MSLAQTGKTLSEEHRRKIGLSSKGRKHTEEFKKSVSSQFRKELSWILTTGGCHECTSHKQSSNGYVSILIEGKHELVHRYSYRKNKGEIPPGLVVRHTCDNRKCMNPEHLILGTPADNVNDTKSRKRFPTGENVKSSKLSEEQVREIRSSNLPDRQLALKYGVCRTNISNIKKRVWWKDI